MFSNISGFCLLDARAPSDLELGQQKHFQISPEGKPSPGENQWSKEYNAKTPFLLILDANNKHKNSQKNMMCSICQTYSTLHKAECLIYYYYLQIVDGKLKHRKHREKLSDLLR